MWELRLGEACLTPPSAGAVHHGRLSVPRAGPPSDDMRRGGGGIRLKLNGLLPPPMHAEQVHRGAGVGALCHVWFPGGPALPLHLLTPPEGLPSRERRAGGPRTAAACLPTCLGLQGLPHLRCHPSSSGPSVPSPYSAAPTPPSFPFLPRHLSLPSPSSRHLSLPSPTLSVRAGRFHASTAHVKTSHTSLLRPLAQIASRAGPGLPLPLAAVSA